MIQCRFENIAADVIEEHVHLVGAGFADAGIDVFVFVIDDVVKTDLVLQPGALFGSPGDANYTATLDAGDLSGYRAGSTGRAGYQHRFPGLRLCQVKQTPVGGEAGHTQCRHHHFRRYACRYLVEPHHGLLRVNNHEVLPAAGGLHHVANGVVGVLRGGHLADGAGPHGLTQLYRGQVAFAVFHPAPLGRIE